VTHSGSHSTGHSHSSGLRVRSGNETLGTVFHASSAVVAFKVHLV
jgi:hypothetical protein